MSDRVPLICFGCGRLGAAKVSMRLRCSCGSRDVDLWENTRAQRSERTGAMRRHAIVLDLPLPGTTRAGVGSGPGYYITRMRQPVDGPYPTPSEALASLQDQSVPGAGITYMDEPRPIGSDLDAKPWPIQPGGVQPWTQRNIEVGTARTTYASLAQRIMAENPTLPAKEAYRIAGKALLD